jgi:hypothetical protein
MPRTVYDVATFSVSAANSPAEASDVTYTGKIFEAGSYPDKAFSLTEDELLDAAAAFSEVHNNIEHKPSPLDGKIGKLTGVVARGKELFGTITVPKQLRDLIGATLKPSLEWDSATKRIVGNALTLTPRIQGAECVAAFSAALEAQLQTEVPMETTATALSADDRSILDKFKALFSGEKPTPNTVTFSREDVQSMISEAVKPLTDANEALKTELATVKSEAVTFSGQSLDAALIGVPPRFHSQIRMLAKSPDVVKFTQDDGKEGEKTGLQMAIEMARDLKDKSKILFRESVEGTAGSINFSGIPAEEVARLREQGVSDEDIAKTAKMVAQTFAGGDK